MRGLGTCCFLVGPKFLSLKKMEMVDIVVKKGWAVIYEVDNEESFI